MKKNNPVFNKPRVYVASPLRGSTKKATVTNMEAARDYEAMAKYLDYDAKAIHAWLPNTLDDRNPLDRKIALKMGLQLLKSCEIVFACGEYLTEGMKGEIEYAMRRGKHVYVFSDALYQDILNEIPLSPRLFLSLIHVDEYVEVAEELFGEDYLSKTDRQVLEYLGYSPERIEQCRIQIEETQAEAGYLKAARTFRRAVNRSRKLSARMYARSIPETLLKLRNQAIG